MKKISITIIITLIMLALLAPVLYAADNGIKKTTMSGTKVFKASDLMNANVMNIQGDSLGKITDLAINARGNVVFAVVSPGVAGKLIPVPISAFKIEENGKVARLDISSEKLEAAPYFTSVNWPDMMNTKLTEDTYRYFGVSPTWDATAPSDIYHQKDMMKDKEMKDDTLPDREMKEKQMKGSY